MRKSVFERLHGPSARPSGQAKAALAVLLAATAVIPSTAFAQDDGRRGGDWARGGPRHVIPADPAPPDNRNGQPPAIHAVHPGWRGEGRDHHRVDAAPVAGFAPSPQSNAPTPTDRGDRRDGRDPGAFNGRPRDNVWRRGDTWRGDDDARRWDGRRWDGDGRRDDDRRWDGDNRRRWDGDRQWRGGGDRWHGDWRRDRRYDWREYRRFHRDVYRLPRYYVPNGWGYGYRRFGIGFRLDSVLFAPRYWIGDPGFYRLPPVYGPYRWVRYYNDAVLVDIYSGQVVDVEYDIFW